MPTGPPGWSRAWARAGTPPPSRWRCPCPAAAGSSTPPGSGPSGSRTSPRPTCSAPSPICPRSPPTARAAAPTWVRRPIRSAPSTPSPGTGCAAPWRCGPYWPPCTPTTPGISPPRNEPQPGAGGRADGPPARGRSGHRRIHSPTHTERSGGPDECSSSGPPLSFADIRGGGRVRARRRVARCASVRDRAAPAVVELDRLDRVQPARAQVLRVAQAAQVRHDVGDGVEDQVDLQARQVGADAEVRAGAAAAQVRVRVTGDVELLRVGVEGLLVEVARGVEDADAVALLDLHPAQLGVAGGGALEGGDRAGPADDLVGRGRRTLGLEQLPLLGVVHE